MSDGRGRGFWRSLWHLLDTTRRLVFNLLFLALLLGAVALYFGGRVSPVPEGAALMVAPTGVLTDQPAGADPLLWWLGEGQPPETRLADLVEAIDRAAEDERIPMLVLRLQDLQGGGLSKMQELAAAVRRFRDSGKPVVAVADYYTQDQYYLAAQADRVLLNPMGAVALEGFAVYRNYFREALDKLDVDVNVFRVGEYKSAVEPLTRNDMSEAARRANQAWLDDLWRQYLEGVSQARQLPVQGLARHVAEYPQRLQRLDGDAARLALETGLVDELMARPAMNDYLQQRLGGDGSGFPAVSVSDYLAATDAETAERGEVGLITASGVIIDGEQPPGAVGGDTIAGLLRQARMDETVRAVVLRIDSGGGSAYASEVIRQELLKLKQAGKPVVVSMGSVAASGGYWIAADADQIWATPATLTGSIGIFGALPTLDRSLQHLGIHTDGIATGPLAGGFRPDRPLSDAVRQVVQAELEQGYERFIDLVATGRGMPAERVEAVARGRVWSGLAARDIGLVDQLGGLRQAQRAAAELAGLEHWRVRSIEPPLSPRERLLRALSGVWAAPVATEGFGGQLARQYRGLWRSLAGLSDPRGFYLLCGVCNAP